ncbi:GntR family transcriptional regulator [Brevibacterium sp. H602]|uniref:GntR family transcriptional regulator n=1 Tax=unclassified Brevibacterium TaxID=2614124 RepID=UPI00397E5ADF
MADSHDAPLDVAAQIRTDIIKGKLEPGTKLREVALTERYEVSRIPIREALRTLEADGLVESRKFSGSVVAPSPAEDAEDLFEIRIVLESATAKRAARRAAELSAGGEHDAKWSEIRAEINEILEAGDAVIADERFEDLAVLNMQFHFAVAELSGSLSFISLLRQISGKIEWLYSLNLMRRGPQAWPEHREIIAAIDAGQVEQAAGTMARHVRRSRDSYFATMSERP